jgi:hypothetical protein
MTLIFKKTVVEFFELLAGKQVVVTSSTDGNSSCQSMLFTAPKSFLVLPRSLHLIDNLNTMVS